MKGKQVLIALYAYVLSGIAGAGGIILFGLDSAVYDAQPQNAMMAGR